LKEIVPWISSESLKVILLEEIPMRMSTIYTPKVVDQDVEHTEQCYQKHGRVFCFESNGDHDTCEKAKGADGDSTGTPTVALEDKAEEEKDKEDSPSKLKVRSVLGGGV
jgi:hypothetical protein